MEHPSNPRSLYLLRGNRETLVEHILRVVLCLQLGQPVIVLAKYIARGLISHPVVGVLWVALDMSY